MKPEEIKKALSSRGIALADLARHAQVSLTTVSTVVSGKARSRRVATLIAKAIGLPIDAVWPGAYPAHDRKSIAAAKLAALDAGSRMRSQS